MNKQLDKNNPEHLRRDSIVCAWIEDYQQDEWHKHEDCSYCGWPHAGRLCGLGQTFARARIGGQYAYIDSSNVAWTRSFVDQLSALGFHWRNDVYIKRERDSVLIHRVEYFNGSPGLKCWQIPVNEFASIVCAASLDGETTERYIAAMRFLGSAVEPTSAERAPERAGAQRPPTDPQSIPPSRSQGSPHEPTLTVKEAKTRLEGAIKDYALDAPDEHPGLPHADDLIQRAIDALIAAVQSSPHEPTTEEPRMRATPTRESSDALTNAATTETDSDWTNYLPEAGIERLTFCGALRTLAFELRSRTWFSPMSAADMNWRDSMLADKLSAIADAASPEPPGEILAWLNTEQKQAHRWIRGDGGVLRFVLTGPELMRIRREMEAVRQSLSESGSEGQEK